MEFPEKSADSTAPRRSDLKAKEANCGIPNTCTRVVPVWLLLLDNIPTLGLFLLGAVLSGMLWRPLAIAILLYDLLAIIMFWGLICRYCQHFDTKACPCGYGIIAPKYFRKEGGKSFREVFRKNIFIMFPCWFVPLGVGVYLLATRSSREILIVFLSFVVLGFLIIPAISRFLGCKGCNLREECPWMS
jgi:hypothetical protein